MMQQTNKFLISNFRKNLHLLREYRIMKYLQETQALEKFITEINEQVIKDKLIDSSLPNHLFLKSENKSSHLKMERFADDYILEQINSMPKCTFLVFTNLVSTQIKGNVLTYFLYKGYSKLTEKGFVYYQVVHNDTLSPLGELLFSNFEDNIFFKSLAPDFEESSCNVIEAAESTATNKKIVFLIGNLNEERLLFDIEHLIVTTAFNSKRHSAFTFHYLLSISIFGHKISDDFTMKLENIKTACNALVENSSHLKFSFEYTE